MEEINKNMHRSNEIIQANIDKRKIEVVITRKKMKNVAIRIIDGKLAINCPVGFNNQNILRLIEKNQKRISAAIDKSSKKIDLSLEPPFEAVLIEGSKYRVITKSEKKASVEISERQKIIIFTAVDDYNFEEAIKAYFSERTRKMVYDYIKENHNDKKINRISIKDNSSNWGSCSSKNNLNFNLRLSMLPLELANYVIEHEIAHLKHLNHSIDFYHELSKSCPGWKDYRSTLKNYTIKAR